MLGQLAAGTVVAGYEIERAIGRGGMGEVYLARKKGERRSVALKLLSPGLSSDERFQARFERESYLAMSLEHPNIVPVYATDEVDGVRYIAMRWVDGPTLRELIDTSSPLNPHRVLSLLAQVASALDDAHTIGLVHRDIKPANVLVSSGGASEFREHAYLTDFGVSKYTGSESGFTQTGQFVGTSLYASPEQIQGDPITGAVDVYALACVLYEALTAHAPYERESEAALLWAHMVDEPPLVTTHRPDLPPELDLVLAKGLTKRPGERYASCGDLIRAARSAVGVPTGDVAEHQAAVNDGALPEPESLEAVPAPATALKPRPAARTPAVDGAREPADATTEPEAGGPAEPQPFGDVVEPIDEPAVPVAATMLKEPPEPTTEEAPELEAVRVVAAGTVLKERPEPDSTLDGAKPIAAPAGAGTVLKAPALTGGAPATVIVDRTPPDRASGWRVSRRIRHPAVLAAAGVLVLGFASVLLFASTRDDTPAATTTSGSDGGVNTTTLPTNTVRPTVSGDRRAGERLTAAPGEWQNDAGAFTYRWQRCNEQGGACRPVRGATQRTYVLTARDTGSRMRVEVSAANSGGEATSVSKPTRTVLPALVAPANASPPAIGGTTQEGGTLTADRGAWKGTKPLRYAYVWLRCNNTGGSCASIPSATRATYRLGSRDVGDRLRVRVRATNAAGKRFAVSKATAAIDAKPTGSTGNGNGDEPPPPPEPKPPARNPCEPWPECAGTG